MNKSSDPNGIPLNLSLNGLQFKSKSSNSSKSVQKSSNLTQRSNLSSGSTSTVNDNIRKKNDQKYINPSSSRSASSFSDKKSKLPPYLKKEEKNKETTPHSSNIFAPSSERSSFDELEISTKKSQISTNPKSGLDIFFSSFSSDNIEPLKDKNNIKKLQDSVDGLRRELNLDTLSQSKLNERELKLKEIRKKLAAISIQNWYRAILNKRLNHQNEIEKLFNQKKVEMKKKMEFNTDKSSSFNKKPSRTSNSSQLSKSNSQMRNNLSPSLKSKDKFDNIFEEKNQDLNNSSNETIDAESVNTDTDLLNNLKKNTTVENLLLSLDQLDRDSQMSSFNKDVALASQTSEKINSILSFLDEEVSKENDFVPKQMKDFKFDQDFFDEFMETNQKLNQGTSKKLARNEDKKSIKTLKPEMKIPPKKTNDSINISKTTARKNADKNDDKLRSDVQKTPRNEDSSDRVMELELELEEKKRKINSLEKALNQQKELTIRYTQEAEKESQIRLETQKNDYESTIKRHLSFIDQLIDDKKVLSEKCEKLVKELKDCEKNYSDRLRNTEEKYKFDTQKLKDTFEAAEKIRREKWIEEKTKKIKEMTVKGLEPEIQSLINKHKNEIKTLKTIHEAELLQADERAAQRYIKITEELRENFEREKEASVQKERDIAKQRYEKSLEEEEKSFLEQRRRLYAEVEEEKNRLAEQASFQRKELDRLKRMLEENNLSSIEAIKKEYATTHMEMEKKHQNELKNLTEKLEIEKQSWEQNYMKKQENWINQKERELKEQVRRERDKEIELVISRLESETNVSREEVERTAENRIKRIRDKYESELREVEKSERETMERFNNLKAKYNELEGEYERLKVLLKQKEKDLEAIKKVTDTLQEERNRLAEIIRQEFSDRLVFTEEENKRIKLEMAELKSRHQYDLEKKKQEVERVQKEKADELNTVHEKIKQVVAKKDEIFNSLKQQYEAACKRADHLEGLLEQQRILMLKKQTNSNRND